MKVKLTDAQKGHAEEDAIALDPDDNTSHAKIAICRPIARLAKRLMRFASMERVLVVADVVNRGVRSTRMKERRGRTSKDGWPLKEFYGRKAQMFNVRFRHFVLRHVFRRNKRLKTLPAVYPTLHF